MRLYDTMNANYLVEYIYLIWNPQKRQFEPDERLNEIPGAVFDQEEKVIYGMTRGSASEHTYFTYRYEGQKIMGTERLERGIGLIESKWKHYAAVFLLLLSMAGIYGCGDAAHNREETEKEEEIAEYKEETQEASYPRILESSSPEDIALAVYSEGIFLVFNGKTYGFLNKTGELTAEFVYEYAHPFSEGLACVKKDGKYGFLNREGETVIPFIYDRANSFSEGLAYFEADGRYGFLNQKGEQVLCLTVTVSVPFRKGLHTLAWMESMAI